MDWRLRGDGGDKFGGTAAAMARLGAQEWGSIGELVKQVPARGSGGDSR
jgi:hypothetical protein